MGQHEQEGCVLHSMHTHIGLRRQGTVLPLCASNFIAEYAVYDLLGSSGAHQAGLPGIMLA